MRKQGLRSVGVPWFYCTAAVTPSVAVQRERYAASVRVFRSGKNSYERSKLRFHSARA
jgi:hypothetical protein